MGTESQARRVSLQDALQDRVKRYIIENGHRPGDPLPPESQMSQQLGVSRSSLREAMRVLQTIGVVESRHGSGTFVGKFSMDPLLEGMSFSIQASSPANALRAMREVLEARTVLERHLIRQVADAITEGQVAQLDFVLEKMRAHADAGRSFPEEDLAFHEAIYTSLGNSFMVQLVRTFWQLFAEVEENLRNIEGELHAIVDAHEVIVEALRSGDADAAELAMTRHLDGIQERVSQAR